MALLQCVRRVATVVRTFPFTRQPHLSTSPPLVQALCQYTIFPKALVSRPVLRPNVLQFIRTEVWKATHRDRASGPRFRLPSTPPPLRSRKPRRPTRRGLLNSIPPPVIFYGIIVLNGLVFVAWNFAASEARQRNFAWYQWMRNNFTSSWNNISSLRPWCLITSCFSHENTGHILFNGFAFVGMAPPVHALLGNAGFLALYLGGGIFANVLSMYWSNKKRHRDVPSHGASAAIYAVVSFLAFYQPKMTFMIMGIIPVPAWACVAGLFAYDGFSSITDKGGRTDTVGHIGGLIAGAGYFFLRRFGLRL